MPCYSYRCPSCFARFEAVMPVELRKTVRCAVCDAVPDIQILKAPMVQAPGEFEPFLSPATGKLVKSRSQLSDDLKASGCHLREPGEEKDTARRRQEIEAESDQKLEQLVHETATGLGL